MKKIKDVHRRSFLSFLLVFALTLSSLIFSGQSVVHAQENTDNILEQFNTDGKFESGMGDWRTSPKAPDTHKAAAEEPTYDSSYYNFWSEAALTYKMYQSLTLPAGSYKLTANICGGGDGQDMQTYVYFNGKVSTASSHNPGWLMWDTVGEDSVFVLAEDDTVEVGLYIILGDKGWGYADNITLTALDAGTAEANTQPVSDVGGWR